MRSAEDGEGEELKKLRSAAVGEGTLIIASNSNGQGKEYIYIHMYHRTSLYKLF